MKSKYIFQTILLILILQLSYSTKTAGQESNKSIQNLASQVLNESSAEAKLKLNTQLLNKIKNSLTSKPNSIQALDSTGLIYELLSKDKQVQVLTWAVLFSKKWEYYGYIKSYNETKKIYEVWELTPTDFIQSTKSKKPHSYDNWPAGVYFNIIESTYNKRKYYTLIGWLAKDAQTAYKFLDVLTLSRSGKPSFGKSSYFSIDKKYTNRVLFAYSSLSTFQLNYGEYDFTEKKWNHKKKKYDFKVYTENLIVFDHLVPMYPDLKDHPEFLVPSGNIVDAFVFEKGKWRKKHDIDARNLKLKVKGKTKPQLNLFPDE